MKKIIQITFTFLLFCSLIPVETVSAQSFEKGHLGISPGINLGRVGFYSGGAGLPFVVSGEYGVHDLVGVGPYVGFVNYSYGSGSSKYKYRFISFGVRGDFHYTTLLEEALDANLNSDQLDLYVALLLGYQTASYSGPEGTFFTGTYGNRTHTGISVGGRFYFNEKLAIFAEAGRVLYGSLNIGVTVKLK